MDPYRIHVVEDEEVTAAVLRQSLVEVGYEVCGVSTRGEEVLESPLLPQPDLLLMDIQLAGSLDGVDTAVRLYEEQRLPVVFLTSHDDDATLCRARAAHPYGFVHKPFDPERLNIVLEVALARHQAQRELWRGIAHRSEEVPLPGQPHARPAPADARPRPTAILPRAAFLAEGARRLRDDRGAVLTCFDLDDLGAINERLGLSAGDRAIEEFGALLLATRRTTDLVGHVGTDEFAVLLDGAWVRETNDFLRRVRVALRCFARRPDAAFVLSTSVGIVATPRGQPASMETLLLRAYRRMYEDKWSRKVARTTRVEGMRRATGAFRGCP
ncbi:MAG: response regulator [Deltaproteobacteria bacterium]|nr:response regulator [Deltaproteobacteria bacterium]